VAVIGAGAVSPIGAGLHEFECALFAGASGIRPSTRLGAEAVAEVQLDFAQRLGKGIRVLDRSARMLCVAVQMALEGLVSAEPGADGSPPEIGLVCGTMLGSVHSIADFDWSGLAEGPNYVNPMAFPNTVINSAAGQAGIRYGLRGLNSTVCAGGASALHALHYAAECLRFGRAELLLAGGAEELSEESLAGLRAAGMCSPSGRPRPFGARRDGMAPGEGCCLWALATEESARARGRSPWFEICGFGARHDARGDHACAAAEAIERALADSGIGPERVACVISGANGTGTGDAVEARALQKVFGTALGGLPVYAPKAALGESLGASGAFGAMAAGLALKRRATPPSLGAEEVEYPLCLSPEPQSVQGEYALVNAFGCDGNVAAMVIRRWEQM
jgi:3-oxoacyl-[acyl-carrier-protein] synthase II